MASPDDGRFSTEGDETQAITASLMNNEILKEESTDPVVDGVTCKACLACGQGFSDEASYSLHLLQHQLENPFKCAVCEQAFSEASLLTDHVRQHQADLEQISTHVDSEPQKVLTEKTRRSKRVRKKVAPELEDVVDETVIDNDDTEYIGPRTRRKRTMRLRQSESRAGVEIDENSEEVNGYVDDDDLDSYLEKDEIKESKEVKSAKPKVLKCSNCPRGFTSHYHLNMHTKVCDGSGRSMKNNRRKGRAVPSTCDVCQKVCISQYHLQLHKQIHVDKTGVSKPPPSQRIGCSICTKTFKNQNALRLHMIVHSNEKNYRCEVCNRRFARKHSLELHRSVHSDELPYGCDLCTARFRRKDSVLSHKKRNHVGSVPRSKRQYYCDLCKDYFQDSSHHKTHENEPKSMRVICELCGNLYANSCILKEHVRTVHQRLRRFECSECGQKFLQSQALKAHLSVHSNERPYLCDTCGKAFRSKKTLDRHKESHIPENAKPMICDICSKAFIRRSHLTRHMKIHDPNRGPPVRKFACTRCDRTFTTRRYLRDHEMIHYRENERPFKCDVCGLRYAQDLDLQRHLLEHDGRRDIPCSECGKNFKSTEQYHFHLRSIHSMEPDPRVEALMKSASSVSTTPEVGCNNELSGHVDVSMTNSTMNGGSRGFEMSMEQQQQTSFAAMMASDDGHQSLLQHHHHQSLPQHQQHVHALLPPPPPDMSRTVFNPHSVPGVALMGTWHQPLTIAPPQTLMEHRHWQHL